MFKRCGNCVNWFESDEFINIGECRKDGELQEVTEAICSCANRYDDGRWVKKPVVKTKKSKKQSKRRK